MATAHLLQSLSQKKTSTATNNHPPQPFFSSGNPFYLRPTPPTSIHLRTPTHKFNTNYRSITTQFKFTKKKSR
ncbi:hypothetical protein HanPI659440_Chr17g0703481 [Helianthus annuus]|nr:hypothetical protein HanPI659440_Chr17g0703481 [Helianthus annuus]